MKQWLFLLLFLFSFLVFAGPKDPRQYTVQYGGLIDLNTKSIVEGSVSNGGLQPDYIIDFSSEAFKPAREYAKSVAGLPLWEKIQAIQKYVRTGMLTDGSYTGPKYLAKMAEYKTGALDIPLSEYPSCNSGVCRENGMISHLLMKEAGIPNFYIYTKSFEQLGEKIKTEGHGFVVLEIDGEFWTADSYNKNFNRHKLKDLLSSEGVANQSGGISKVLQISEHPVVWQHKSLPHSGHDFRVIPQITYEGPNVEVGEFVEPNELHPWDQTALLEKAPAGVHLSVGTERGFLGFSMNQAATHLLLIDVDSQVVRFNQMNIGLLAVSDEMGTYNKLRNTASFKNWKKIIEDRAYYINDETKALLLSEENFEWWRKIVSTQTYANKLERIGSGYWKDTRQFARLQKAAREGKLQAARVNLTDNKQMSQLADHLQAKGLSISVLDMSSAWMPRYVPDGAVESIRSSVKSALKDQSLFLLSKGDTKYGVWKYLSFMNSFLEASPEVVGAPQLLETFSEFSGSRYVDVKGNIQSIPQGETLPPVSECDSFFTRIMKKLF